MDGPPIVGTPMPATPMPGIPIPVRSIIIVLDISDSFLWVNPSASGSSAGGTPRESRPPGSRKLADYKQTVVGIATILPPARPIFSRPRARLFKPPPSFRTMVNA